MTPRWRRGRDLLIAGTTAYDGNEAALAAIMAEWTSGRDYATRIANLSGTGSGPRDNGSVFLMASGPARRFSPPRRWTSCSAARG